MRDTIAKNDKIHGGNGAGRPQAAVERVAELHPAWQAMMQFCRDIRYGEIALIKIHDGIPISAEIATKKIRWY